jgi:hypothetical protein
MKLPFSPGDAPEQVYYFTAREINAYIHYDAPIKESNSNRIERRDELNRILKDAKEHNKKIVYVRIECIQRLNLSRVGMREPIAVLELSQDDARLTLTDLNDELIDDTTASLDKLTHKVNEFLKNRERILVKCIWNEGIALEGVTAIISALIIFWFLSGREYTYFVNSVLESIGVLIVYALLVFVANKLMRKDERVIFVYSGIDFITIAKQVIGLTPQTN